jgi:hypothetical protein
MKKFLVFALGTLAVFGVVSVFSAGDAEANLPATHTNQRWLKLASLGATDVQSDGGTKTITLPAIAAQNGVGMVFSETLIKERTAFVHTNNDGGAQTLVLDVGKSGALERFAKDVSLKQTAGTVTLGSGTTSVKPRNYEANGVAPVITLTSGDQADALSRVTAGRVDIYVLVENAPR